MYMFSIDPNIGLHNYILGLWVYDMCFVGSPLNVCSTAIKLSIT